MPRITGQIQNGPHIDFCILGASKSGKTGLAAYLRTHLRIFLPTTEPNFYADDIAQYAPMPRPKNRQAYRELFAGAAEGQLLGEVSGLYLSSERAVPNILKDSPDARFIVMLRNPVEIAHSAHSNLLRSQFEDERSFQKAWELQEARAAGERIPRLCKEPKLLLYRQRSSFASQMERFLQWVPRERVLVHIFEEFFADPRAAYKRTLAFLGLPDDERRHFERVNEHGVPHSWWLHRLAVDPPFPLNRLYAPLKRAFNAFGLRPGAATLRANIGNENFAPMEPSFRRRLEAEFQPDIARLEEILGRNLDIWKSE
jgi:sulfotransferase family protein